MSESDAFTMSFTNLLRYLQDAIANQGGLRLLRLARFLRPVCAGALFLLASCKSAALDVACLPDQARTWMVSAEAKRIEGCNDADVSVYFDRSESMRGFIFGADPRVSQNGEHVLGDVAKLMREAAPCDGGVITYKGFGAGIQPLDATAPDQAGTKGFYGGGIGAWTRLEGLFNEIAESPGAAMVITDLWRGDPEEVTSGSVSLSAPFHKIFESGRSIAIFGFNAPFAGYISDVPGARPFPLVGTHPFYLIAVGSVEHLEHTRRELETGAAQFVREGLTGKTENVRYALFSPTAVQRHAASATPFKAGRVPGLQLLNTIPLANGTELQQFVFDLDEARRAELKQSKDLQAAIWTTPTTADVLPGAVWSGTTLATTRTWSRVGSGCGQSGWAKEAEIAGWKPDPGTARQFALDGGVLLRTLQRKGTYLVSGEVSPTFDRGEAPDALAWMSEWSLGARDARELASAIGDGSQRGAARGTVGTLYLADTRQVLLTSLAEATQRKPRPVAGFTILVQVR